MNTYKVLEFIIWLVLGILVLLSDKVSKREYALLWVCFLLKCVVGIMGK